MHGVKNNLFCKNYLRIAFILLIALVFFNIFGCTENSQTNESPNKNTGNIKQSLRIISQIPNITEICFALGLQKNLVGITNFCDYPEETKNIEKIGGIMNPDFELVQKLKPDLIILQNTLADLEHKYKQLGIKTLSVKAQTTSDITSAIHAIGEATGHSVEAKKLNDKINRQLESVMEKAKQHKPVKAMLVIGHETGSLKQIYAAGPDFFHGELLKMAGGENCISTTANPYPQISAEELLNLSPEVIILISAKELNASEKKKELELWQTLSYVKAVRNNRICILDKSGMFIPGPRIGNIAKDFFNCLHK